MTPAEVTLTEAEADALWNAIDRNILDTTMFSGDSEGEIEAAVADLIAARLAPIRALLDEWEANRGGVADFDNGRWHRAAASRLYAALDASSAPMSAQQDHDGAEGQGGAERAGEGDLCAAECGKPVDRTIPNPIPEGFDLMWSESMSGRALYCQACFDKPDPEETR